MSVETASYPASLDTTLPLNTDPLAEADDHLRLIKTVVKNAFPNINAPVTATPDQLNSVVTTTGGQTIAGTTTLNAASVGTLAATSGTITSLSGSGANFSGTVTANQVNTPLVAANVLASAGLISGGSVAATGVIDAGGGIYQGGNKLIPAGVIAIWAGLVAGIPPGWTLYSGTGGFPTYIQKT